MILLALACLEPHHQPLGEPRVLDFAEQAQPVLASRCANPSCHGDAERPLELYAVHFHRADGATHLDEPLSHAELRANALRVLGVGVGVEPAMSPALRKPLAEATGGTAHEGGALFGDTGNVDYRALRGWLEDTGGGG